MAPTTAPTHVFAMLTTFSGVYTAAYKPMLAPPKAAAVLFACIMPEETLQEGSSQAAVTTAVNQAGQGSNAIARALDRRSATDGAESYGHMQAKEGECAPAWQGCRPLHSLRGLQRAERGPWTGARWAGAAALCAPCWRHLQPHTPD